MNRNKYDISEVISEAIRGGYDIAPDRMEWVKLCHAMKILEDKTSFVALSSIHGTSEREIEKKWKEERNFNLNIKTEDDARGLIVSLAKQAGIEVSKFSLLQKEYNSGRANPRGQTARRRKSATKETAAPQRQEPPRQADYLPEDMLTTAQRYGEQTGFFAWLRNEFGLDAARNVFRKYRIGGSQYTDESRKRAAVFPYINTQGRVVDGKIFHIDQLTGSRKTSAALRVWVDGKGKTQEFRSSWAIAELNRQRRKNGMQEINRAPWCNFGDHLLQEQPTAEVCLVESEKTAVICSLVYPERVWIAAGSKNNLTVERCAAYAGRHITLFPDRDGIDEWRNKAKQLTAAGLIIRIDTTLSHYDGNLHDDIADLILRFRHGEQQEPQPAQQDKTPDQVEAERIFEQMAAENNSLRAFATALWLIPLGVG